MWIRNGRTVGLNIVKLVPISETSYQLSRQQRSWLINEPNMVITTWFIIKYVHRHQVCTPVSMADSLSKHDIGADLLRASSLDIRHYYWEILLYYVRRLLLRAGFNDWLSSKTWPHNFVTPVISRYQTLLMRDFINYVRRLLLRADFNDWLSSNTWPRNFVISRYQNITI